MHARRLTTQDYFKTDEQYVRALPIVDAVEIMLESENDEGDLVQTPVKWDVISYDDEFLDIRVNLDGPERFSKDLGEDFISVTFYGTEFFTDDEDVAIEFGTSV